MTIFRRLICRIWSFLSLSRAYYKNMSQSLFRRRPSRSRRGALIIEAMMAILLFGLFATAAFSGLITGQEGSRVGSDRVRGVFYAERGLEIAKTIRDGSFSTLAQTQDPLTPPP